MTASANALLAASVTQHAAFPQGSASDVALWAVLRCVYNLGHFLRALFLNLNVL